MTDPVDAVAQEEQDSPLESIAGYRLVKLVGRGGMGSVYKAVAPDGKICAIKILANRLHRNKTLLARFHREAETAIRLDHRNIVRGYDYGEENNHHYFVMEYISGTTLLSLLQKRGRLPEKTAIEISVALANGLHLAHQQGVIHRDVKPDNILIDRRGCVKLTDLGLVKSLDDEKVRQDLTVAGSGLGTHQYMPPEQFDDAKNASPQFDIYSLGATLYTMVTGQFPFEGEGAVAVFVNKTQGKFTPPEILNPHLSDRTLAVIRSSLSAKPEERPQSAREFAEILAGMRPFTKPSNANAKSESKASRKPPEEASPAAKEEQFWYVVFYTKKGERQKCRGPQSAIEREICEGRLPPQSYVSIERYGKYRPAVNVPEFIEVRKRFAPKRKPNPIKRLLSSVTGMGAPEDPPDEIIIADEGGEANTSTGGENSASPHETDLPLEATEPATSSMEEKSQGNMSAISALPESSNGEMSDLEAGVAKPARSSRFRAILVWLFLIATAGIAGTLFWWSQQ